MVNTAPQYTAETWPTSAALLQFPGADILGRSVNNAEASVWEGVFRQVADAGLADVDLTDSWVRPGTGEACSERAGGTSGALWGAALIAIGNALGNKDSYDGADAAATVTAFATAIAELGKAELGDKTMVDALLPFAEVFTAELGRGAPVDRALTVTAQVARMAADRTAELSPKKGCARPLAEKSLGHADPGAISCGLVAQGLADTFASLSTQRGA
jgi:dihydroxyacetone kinase